MLNVLQWEWHSVQSQARDDGDGSAERVVGVAACGLDLVAGLFIRLQQEHAEAAGHYPLQSALFSDVGLHPRNRRALALLRGWMSGPEDLGKPWWDDFEQELRQQRLAFRETA